MTQRRSRRATALSAPIEGLEARSMLSGSAASLPSGTAEVAATGAKTTTTLSIHAGTLGQPISFGVTVRAAASAGAPMGTVVLTDHGQVIDTLTLAPSAPAGGKLATSQATATLVTQPGSQGYFFGKHPIVATFVPAGGFARSTATGGFTVTTPAYHSLPGGVKVATVTPGSGAYIQSGQTANVLYTGYLAKSGKMFDDSVSHGDAPLAFTLGAQQVVNGFDEGTTGMQVGETRLILIPAAQGYGATANGPIPANSTLLFAVTLESIA